MKNIIIVVILSIVSSSILAQNKRISQDSVINKWFHATFNIECKPSNRIIFDSLAKLFENKKIDVPTYKHWLDTIRLLTPTFSGTAIFLEYNNMHYLLTARHVLADIPPVDSNSIFGVISLVENDTMLNDRQGMSIDSSYNVYFKNGAEISFLSDMMLGRTNYIFSSKDQDIGIINLDKASKEFTKVLLKRGYMPIHISDIETTFREKQNQDVFIIGFPIESIQGTKIMPKVYYFYEARYITIPFISFGKISKVEKEQYFFDANIFAYHGNSGGPVISNNKLIGIVSRLSPDTISTGFKAPFNKYFVFHHRFIKSSLILPLLKELESR